ncbi:hypothetical protein BH10CYA1_BH10CYA1_35850 [soil metagenome]
MSGKAGATLEKATREVNEHSHEHEHEHVHETDHVNVHGEGHGAEHVQEHNSRQTIVSMDTLGIFASTLCLIHCLAMPLVVAFLPLLGLQFLEGHNAHQALAGFVVAFGLLAILPGYMKHRKPAVLAGLVLGLTFVLAATFGDAVGLSESAELPLITVGNLVLVVSHLFNRKLCQCKHGH